MKVVLGILVVIMNSSCSTNQPLPPQESNKAFRKTAAQAPEGTVSLKTIDGTEVEVPRSEINRVNEESCPPCDKGLFCNNDTKKMRTPGLIELKFTTDSDGDASFDAL